MKNQNELKKLQDSQKPSLVLDSKDLFSSGKMVLIKHYEDWYRLTLTKQGKLILTK